MATTVGGSVPAATASHTFTGGNHHTVLATVCDNPGCGDPPDLIGSGGASSVGSGAFEANAGSSVVTKVELSMLEGPTCPVPGALCGTPSRGQTEYYEVRSALTIAGCNSPSATKETAPQLGRNIVASWTVPTAPPGALCWACVAKVGATVALTGTYVNFVVY
ncbi:MAG TPA: hypothetical protein VNA57_10980 [Acidimicrobiales bacterium]|nr:hypothetical protein [Acidimicrobiales bacterium]